MLPIPMLPGADPQPMTYAVSEIRSAGKPRRKRLSHAAIEPWLYLSPAIILLIVVLLVPLVIGISYSFRKFSAFKSEYVGLGQYQAMLSDQVLGQALVNTLVVDGGQPVLPVLPRPRPGAAARQAVPGPQGGAGAGVPALGGAVLPFGPDLGLAVQPDRRAAAALAVRAGAEGRADQHSVRSCTPPCGGRSSPMSGSAFRSSPSRFWRR